MNFPQFLKRSKAGFLFFLIVGMLIISVVMTSANVFSGPIMEGHSDGTEQLDEEVHEEELDAGKMIIEHLIDSHEWHLWTYKGLLSLYKTLCAHVRVPVCSTRKHEIHPHE